MFSFLRYGFVLLALGIPLQASAHEFYVTRVPNRAMAENDVGMLRACITCHDNADGGAGCEDAGGSRPCLNPFGTEFRTRGFLWDETLAAMDADGDGFTNGQELQDPTGMWRPGMEDPGIVEYVTRPGFAADNPGMHDDDNDGYCWFGRDMDASGDCTGAGENDGSLDCDDDQNTVNSGADELCTNAIDNDCNGLPTLEDPTCEDVVDRDGDGFCRMGQDMNSDRDCIDEGETTEAVDCDDDAITVFPGNRENCADDLDNDCNGRADDADDMCRSDVDNDGDGYCPIGRDENDDGDCLDAGEEAGGFDCDDTEAAVNPGQTEICDDALDNDCDGDPNFEDSECRALFDSDGDGHCPQGVDLNEDQDCIDEGEDVEPFDCDDDDSTISPSIMEVCTNEQDDDCDTIVSLADEDCAGYLDRDGDRYCFVGFDMNRDGDCADAGEEGGSTDCDDENASIVPAVGGEPTMEVCTDSVDNNCDGSTDAGDPMCRDYRDSDRDGWCDVGQDLNEDGDCSDENEQNGIDDESMRDAEPEDSTVYPGAPENCLDMKDNDQDGLIDEGPLRFEGDYRDEGTACVMDSDADGDGWCPIGRDTNGDGDCLDEGENVAKSDCNDNDAERHPGVEELCRNLFDDDCDSQIDLLDTDCFRLLDRDGDGYCGEGIDDNGDGDCLDEAEDRFGADCDDANAEINVRAREVCDDEIDNDCDGNIDAADTQCGCTVEMCDDSDPCTLDMCGDEGCEHAVDPTCTDGGMSDAGSGGDDDGGGCDCRVPGRASGPWAVIVLIALGWAWWRKRV